MRRTIISLAFFLVAGAGWPQELKRFPMDGGTASPGAVIDATVKAEGTGSLKISVPGPSTRCLGQVPLDGMRVENATLMLRARPKGDLEGAAYLELWVTVDGKSYFSKGLPTAVEGKRDWVAAEVPFHLQKGQRATLAVLNLAVNGKGTVWVDDLVLSKEALPPAK